MTSIWAELRKRILTFQKEVGEPSTISISREELEKLKAELTQGNYDVGDIDFIFGLRIKIME